ncbi:MAG: translation initiation factor IF-3 [Ignavibacteriales bacterium]|nr:translation initiation factor IF-3 [Ignavibacteriales bacterium]MBI3786692.1 translation initiation factor IF-3 [Ignavibacteriales bacterium]
MNTEIKAPRVRVIDDEGQQVGVLSTKEAQKLAVDKGLDLIEIVPTADPPVCKIMDFGKYKYEVSKKEKLQKKHQHITLVKEIRFHPNTDTHDFEFKTRHARTFIEEGHKVKAAVVFKGREITYQEQGRELLDRFTERLSDIAKLDAPAKMEGRQMIAYYIADRTKKKGSEKGTESKQPTEAS